MKTAVVSLYHDNYEPLAELVGPNWQEYCDRHGYELCVHKGVLGAGAIGFQKLRYLYDLMFVQKRIELALVVDLDLVFTNLTRRIEEFTDFSGDYFVTKDTNGINNGSFIIRASAWSRWLIETMISHHDKLTNEQDVLKLNEAILTKQFVKIVEHPAFNSLQYGLYPEWGDPSKIPGQWEQGHYVHHWPGLQLDRRLVLIKELLDSDKIVR